MLPTEDEIDAAGHGGNDRVYTSIAIILTVLWFIGFVSFIVYFWK